MVTGTLKTSPDLREPAVDYHVARVMTSIVYMFICYTSIHDVLGPAILVYKETDQTVKGKSLLCVTAISALFKILGLNLRCRNNSCIWFPFPTTASIVVKVSTLAPKLEHYLKANANSDEGGKNANFHQCQPLLIFSTHVVCVQCSGCAPSLPCHRRLIKKGLSCRLSSFFLKL